ncbi:MAG: bacteriohemerythrin [Bacteroidota bacterium]
MRMPWLTSLTLGIGGFDDDHRHLFDLLNELNASIAVGNQSGVRALFDELQLAASEHFRHEEEVMARTGYPRAVAHMAEHDRARQALSMLHGEIVRGRLNRMAECLSDYAGHYFHGVLKDDALLARFLGEQAGTPHGGMLTL